MSRQNETVTLGRIDGSPDKYFLDLIDRVGGIENISDAKALFAAALWLQGGEDGIRYSTAGDFGTRSKGQEAVLVYGKDFKGKNGLSFEVACVGCDDAEILDACSRQQPVAYRSGRWELTTPQNHTGDRRTDLKRRFTQGEKLAFRRVPDTECRRAKIDNHFGGVASLSQFVDAYPFLTS